MTSNWVSRSPLKFPKCIWPWTVSNTALDKIQKLGTKVHANTRIPEPLKRKIMSNSKKDATDKKNILYSIINVNLIDLLLAPRERRYYLLKKNYFVYIILFSSNIKQLFTQIYECFKLSCSNFSVHIDEIIWFYSEKPI